MLIELDGEGQSKGMRGIQANMIQIEEGAAKILDTAERGKGKGWFKRKVRVLTDKLNALAAKDPTGERSELVARIRN